MVCVCKRKRVRERDRHRHRESDSERKSAKFETLTDNMHTTKKHRCQRKLAKRNK